MCYNMEKVNLLLNCALLVAFMAAFVVGLLRKWGVIERLQVFGDMWLKTLFPAYNRSFMYQLAGCNFCLSFWACVICSVIMSIGTLSPIFILTPIFATPVCRILI